MFKVILTLIFIYSSHWTFANGVDAKQLGSKFERLLNNKDVKQALKVSKEIRDDLRKIADKEKNKPKQKKKMVPTDTQSYVDMEVCVDCGEIARLTESVNEILAKSKETQDPKSDTSLELNNLIAVTTIIQTIKDNKTDCYRNRDLTLSEEFVEIEESDLVLEFSQEIDTYFASGQFYNTHTQHKTIWLRGSGDDLDKVVRVDIDKNNKRTLSYYRLKNVDKSIKAKKVVKAQDDNLPSLGRDTKVEEVTFEDKTSGELSLTGDFEWHSDDKKDYLKMTVGPELDYKYYLPKNVRVLSIEAESEIFDQYLIQSTAKVDAKDQEAEVKIIDGEDNKEVIKLKVDKSNLTVDVPYDQVLVDVYSVKGNIQSDSQKGETLKASLYDSSNDNILFNVTAREEKIDFGIPYEQDIYGSYNVQGIIGTDTLGTHRMTASVRQGKSELFNTQYSQNANGNQSMAIGSKQNVHENGTLSVKLRRDIIANQELDSAWLNYEVKF